MKLPDLPRVGSNEPDSIATPQSPVYFCAQVLEDRVLYSAVPVPVDAMVDPMDSQAELNVEDVFAAADNTIEALSMALAQIDSVDDSSLIGLPLIESDDSESDVVNQLTTEIVFVDTSVDGYQELVDDISSQNGNGRNIRVFNLDADSDGVMQITEQLARYDNIDAIHLVTHGSDSRLQIGDVVVSAETLDDYRDAISSWRYALTEDADLLIYGCNVAETDLGKALVEELSNITSADVAASDDTTGHINFGGDWNLEYAVGSIEAEHLFSSSIVADWDYKLPVPNVEPTGTDNSVAVPFGNTYVVSAADFGFNDADGGIFTSILVTSVATEGALQISGVDVAVNDVIDVSNILSGDLIYYAGPAETGADSFGFRVNDGFADSLVANTMTFQVGVPGELWLTTKNDISSGSSDLTSWKSHDVLRFGGPNLELGSSTVADGQETFGQLSLRASLAIDGVDIDAIDYVSKTTTLGTSFQTTLNAGDILFSVKGGGGSGYSFGGLTGVDNHDILIYRPTLGDYSNGTYEILSDHDFGDIKSLSLVETTTTIGDSVVQAGEILFTKAGGSQDADILVTQLSETGVGNTVASERTLIVGSEIGLDDKISGLHLVEEATVVGGVALSSGTLLVSVEKWDFVGTGDTLGVDRQDIFALDVSTTSENTSADATASLFFDASDTNPSVNNSGLSEYPITNDSALHGIALVSQAYQLPTANEDLYSVNEDGSINIDAASGVLANDGVGQGFNSVVGVVSGFDVQHGVLTLNADGSFSYTPNPDFYGFDSFTYEISDQDNNRSTATVVIDVNPVGHAPTDLSTGIQLNNGDGNDAYLIANDGNPTSLFAGATAFTLESEFQIEQVSGKEQPLLSYVVGTSDEVSLVIGESGTLEIEIKNSRLATTSVNLQLLDGDVHHVAVSWNSEGGVVQFFIDGSLVETVRDIQAGQAILGGGTLVVGQEQDVSEGGFEANQSFRGTLHDIRIWDDVRSISEVEKNQGFKFDATDVPNGLVANWRMTELASGTTVVDLVNSTNNLVVRHAGGVGFVGSTPSDQISIDENSSNGSSVGFVMPTDSDSTYDAVRDGSFLNATEPPNGNLATYFAGGGGSGNQIGDWTVVKNSVDLRGSSWEASPAGGRAVDLVGYYAKGTIEQTFDTESGREYQITFAISGNFEGNETTQGLSLTVNGEPTKFSFSEPAGWSRNNLQWETRTLTFVADSTTTTLQFEALTGSTRGALVSDVKVIDSRFENTNGFTYQLIDSSNGRFSIDTHSGEIAVLDGSQLDFELSTFHDVVVQVTDDVGMTYQESIRIQLGDVNETPTLDTNLALSVTNGEIGAVISSSILSSSDVDSSDTSDNLFYRMTTLPANGDVLLNGIILGVGDRFTQQDVDNSLVTYDHDGTSTTSDSFGFSVEDGLENGVVGINSSFNFSIAPAVDVGTFDVNGRIAHDKNGDGQLSENMGFANVQVRLYRDTGDGIAGASDVFVSATTSDVNGVFRFNGLDNLESYWVAVDSKSISSTSLNSGFVAADLWAEQTYGDGNAQFGGRNVGQSDDATSLALSQHISLVSKPDHSNIDFGFSFNAVTHTLGGDAQDDDAAVNQRSVQGSLRQFIVNANALDGDNAMRFVPGFGTNAGAGVNAWWNLDVSTALPDILDDGTTIDGRAYAGDGVSILDTNTGALGRSGNVGVGVDGFSGTGDEGVLNGVFAPELQITNNGANAYGLNVKASDTEVANLAIVGFDQANIFVDGSTQSVTGFYLHDSVIGSEAGLFTQPGSHTNQNENILVVQADSGTIDNNLIGFAGTSGILLKGTSDNSDRVNAWNVRGNVIQGNGILSPSADGMTFVHGVTNVVISDNVILRNAGHGIDTSTQTSGTQITSNTIRVNGAGAVEAGGVRLFGTANVVLGNVIAENFGSGIHVAGESNNGSGVFSASTGNLLSKNSFYGNRGVAIDLSAANTSLATMNNGDGITPNDGAVSANDGNQGLDYPVVTHAVFEGSDFVITGNLNLGMNLQFIEVYLATPGIGDSVGGDDYGEGSVYLGRLALADMVVDGGSGDFAGRLSRPVNGWPAGFENSGYISVVGVDASNNTSEFGKTVQVNRPVDPVAAADKFKSESVAVKSITNEQLLGNDANVVAADSTIVITKQPVHGKLVQNANGFEYIPVDPTYVGNDSFEYKIVTSFTESASAKVDLSLTESAPPTEAVVSSAPPPTSETKTNEPVEEEQEEDSDSESDGEIEGGLNHKSSGADQFGNVGQEEGPLPSILNPEEFASARNGAGSIERGVVTADKYAFVGSVFSSQSAESTASILRSQYQQIANGLEAGFQPLSIGFWSGLDEATEQFDTAIEFQMPTVVAVTSILTAGTVVWMARAGALLGTFMSTMPAWRSFDPLPILESGIPGNIDDNKDSLERLVDNESV